MASPVQFLSLEVCQRIVRNGVYHVSEHLSTMSPVYTAPVPLWRAIWTLQEFPGCLMAALCVAFGATQPGLWLKSPGCVACTERGRSDYVCAAERRSVSQRISSIRGLRPRAPFWTIWTLQEVTWLPKPSGGACLLRQTRRPGLCSPRPRCVACSERGRSDSVCASEGRLVSPKVFLFEGSAPCPFRARRARQLRR